MSEIGKKWAEAWNKIPRRVEGDGLIRWYIDDKLVCKVTTDEYYRDGHCHPPGCTCDALIHDPEFDPWAGKLPARMTASITAFDEED
jgi:hypothetical protein